MERKETERQSEKEREKNVQKWINENEKCPHRKICAEHNKNHLQSQLKTYPVSR